MEGGVWKGCYSMEEYPSFTVGNRSSSYQQRRIGLGGRYLLLVQCRDGR